MKGEALICAAVLICLSCAERSEAETLPVAIEDSVQQMRGALKTGSLLAAQPTSAGESGPSAADDSGWRVAVVGGVGHAYGLLGAHVELRRGHWAGFLGGGVQGAAGPAVAAGVKFFSRQGEGLVVSLHADVNPYLLGSNLPPEMFAVVAATIGWRFRRDQVFLELGIGPAFSYYRYNGLDERTGRVLSVKHVGFGAFGPYPDDGPPFPDLALAVGFEF